MKRNDKTIKQIYQEWREFGYSKTQSLSEALDDKLTGNVFYDFWWWNIWSNLKTPFHKIKEHHKQKGYDKERIKDGVSEQDVWCLYEYLYEVTYKGCLKMCKVLWGERDYPLSNSEVQKMGEKHFTFSQNRDFCMALQRYIKAYETYQPYDNLEGFPESDAPRKKNNFLKRFFLPGKCFKEGTDSVLETPLSRKRSAEIQKYAKRANWAYAERYNAFIYLITHYMKELTW